MNAYENILLGVTGLLNASEAVSPAEWRSFGEYLALPECYRHFNALVYAAMLRQDEVFAHEARVHEWGVRDYRVRGDLGIPNLLAVSLLYPDT